MAKTANPRWRLRSALCDDVTASPMWRVASLQTFSEEGKDKGQRPAEDDRAIRRNTDVASLGYVCHNMHVFCEYLLIITRTYFPHKSSKSPL